MLSNLEIINWMKKFQGQPNWMRLQTKSSYSMLVLTKIVKWQLTNFKLKTIFKITFFEIKVNSGRHVEHEAEYSRNHYSLRLREIIVLASI